MSTSEARYISIASKDNFTTAANTDIVTDVTISEDGILRIGVETTAAADVRITLDGTNYTTLADTAADIWQFFEVPVKLGDIFNIQTVAIGVISFRAILDTGGFYDSQRIRH